jgi:hypothetical protein
VPPEPAVEVEPTAESPPAEAPPRRSRWLPPELEANRDAAPAPDPDTRRGTNPGRWLP